MERVKFITKRLPATARSSRGAATAISPTSSPMTNEASPSIAGDVVAGDAGHTHANKSLLDRLGESEGYLTVNTPIVIDEGSDDESVEYVNVRANVGYADRAGIADQADDLAPTSPIFEKFLRKDIDDHAHGRPTFEGGLAVGEYIQGSRGAEIDADGNAEVESLTARSYLKVFELIYNRLSATEGNTSFADVGNIDAVEDIGEGKQRLTMRRRWDSDYTTFKVGDIVYGYVNDLAHGGAYYRAWAIVDAVDTVNNTIDVYTYSAAECPGSRNYPLTANMLIARWGNAIEPTALNYSLYRDVIVKREGGYANPRQNSFYISAEDGNIVQLMGVNRPILEPFNYGTIVGKIPHGVLDATVEAQLNPDQPYLYARGIIVQDLIRVDYNGLPTRTANYRGLWQPTLQYTSVISGYDTVTWQNCLWQCVASNVGEEPGTSGAWVKMAGADAFAMRVWDVVPTTNTITVHADGEVSPMNVTCDVYMRGDFGSRLMTDTVELAAEHVTLLCSVDGGEFAPFGIGLQQPLECEEGAPITTEDNSLLYVGGDRLDVEPTWERITFVLRDTLTDVELARADVAVVRDGAKGDKGDDGKDGEDGKDGKDGSNGLLIYPAGNYDPTITYTSDGVTSPVVHCNGGYYVLRSGKSYKGIESTYVTPNDDYAHLGSASSWYPVERFNAIFADIVFANFAKLASAVIYGTKMISEQGVDEQGNASNDYQNIGQGFTPNLSIDFDTGEVVAYNFVTQARRVTITATSYQQYQHNEGVRCPKGFELVTLDESLGDLTRQLIDGALQEGEIRPYVYMPSYRLSLDSADLVGRSIRIRNNTDTTFNVYLTSQTSVELRPTSEVMLRCDAVQSSNSFGLHWEVVYNIANI